MEVSTKELENRQAVLIAQVEEEWLDPFLRTASKRLANRVAVPGFRKGKAPHGIVVQHMGKEALIREVIDDLGKAAYDEALEESELEPIQLDDFEITELDPLTLSMTVSLEPTIDLGDYPAMPVTLEEATVEGVEVEDVITSIQEAYAERVPVERPATLGDFASVDLEGRVESRVVLKLDKQEYHLQPDADFPVGDFSNELTGISVDEERSFSLVFPDDYEDEDLAGQEVDFQVRLISLWEKNLPEMDDDLAKMVGGLATLEELRDKVEADLCLQRQAEQKDELAENLLSSLVEQAQIDYPPLFLNRELEAMVRALAFDLQKQSFTLEGYLNTTGSTAEDLLDEFRPVAEERVKKSLILAELVRQEGIEAQDSEIEEELTRITEVYGKDTAGVKDALLSNEQVREDTRNTLYGRKVVEHLSEVSAKAQGREVAEAQGSSPEGDETPVSLDEKDENAPDPS